MADPSMTIRNKILFVSVELYFLAGFLPNVFIVAVNISEWKKGRPLSTVDKVITSLGISRMLFQVVCLLNAVIIHYFYTLNFWFFVSVTFLETTSVMTCIWLSTLLSVVFCLKISTLHNAFFLWLKSLVLNRVFHLIVASVVVCVSYALVYCWTITREIPHNSTYETYNNALSGLMVSLLIFRSIGPFLIYFMSSVLLIIYLYHHTSRMRSERNGTSHLNIYYKTIKFTGSSLFFSTFYIFIDQTFPYFHTVFGLIGLLVFWQLFPTLHSMYLIYMTAKLRIQVSNMVRLLRRRCSDHKASVETGF